MTGTGAGCRVPLGLQQGREPGPTSGVLAKSTGAGKWERGFLTALPVPPTCGEGREPLPWPCPVSPVTRS